MYRTLNTSYGMPDQDTTTDAWNSIQHLVGEITTTLSLIKSKYTITMRFLNAIEIGEKNRVQYQS